MNPRDTYEGRQLERAARRYAAGLERTNCSRRGDVNAASQAENYRAGLERNIIVARRVKDVIEAMGVPAINAVAYRSFGLQLDKLTRRHGSETLRLLATEAIATWTARGLEPRVLTAICTVVFGLEV